jgi:predicted metal-dependent hydrolase
MSLRVSRQDGQVVLTFPARAREREALAFLAQQTDWLRRTLARLPPPPPPVAAGSVIPVEGRPLRIVPGTGRGVRIDGDTLAVPGDAAQVPARLAAFLRTLARQRLQAACAAHAARLGRPFRKITLRDPRSRWGSCTTAGDLMFAWRLILAPPAVLDYVAAHEVAHLAEMNHSPAFWAVVDRLCPGWQAQRAWLKAQGAALQALRF